ncbi:hypothetical protein ACFQVC_09665 [Streptomyces monticola]|uniref:Uncharacterized protein n=1 Tax=Streptomyces monticola TaxID=2666263 RepID=A0ABW2JGR1_9ACTN
MNVDELVSALQRQRQLSVGKLHKGPYEVRLVLPDGKDGNTVAYVHQGRESGAKQHLVLSADEARTQVVAHGTASNASRQLSSYTVTDARGKTLGTFGRDVKRSALRPTWRLEQPGLGLCLGNEGRSRAVARRAWHLMPTSIRTCSPVDVAEDMPYRYEFRKGDAYGFTVGRGAFDCKICTPEITEAALARRVLLTLAVVMAGLQLTEFRG